MFFPPRVRALARLVASAVAGVCVALAFPPFDLVWLMPFGLAGLMLTVQGRRGRGGFAQGFAFGLGFMLPLLRWVTVIGDDAWVALSVLEALFYGLMAMTWAWMRTYRWWPIGFAVSWVGAELLRSTVPFGGMPWGNLAFGLVQTTMDRYGRLGGSALVAFAAVLVVALLVAGAQQRPRSLVSGALAACGLAVGLVSLVLPVGADGATGQLRVAAVQGNVPGEGMDPFAQRRAVLNNHSEATIAFAQQVELGQRQRPDVVIWPENSTDIDPFTDPSAYNEINAAVQAIGVPTLVGAVVVGPDAHHVQNMGIVWDPRTGPGEEYVKRHLVPFGEYIPFRDILTKFISRLSEIPVDFAPGSKDGVLKLGPTTIGDVMCFEVAYDQLVHDVISGGGRVLVVQTNNATYTGTGQLEQQFAISRYRAIETGRSVVIAATNGISAIIAPDGTVVASTKQRTREVLDQPVELADGLTWGVRFGGSLKVVLAVIAIGLSGFAYLGRGRAIGKIER